MNKRKKEKLLNKRKEEEALQKVQKNIEDKNKKAHDDLLRIAEEKEEKRLKKEKALEDKKIHKIKEKNKKS